MVNQSIVLWLVFAFPLRSSWSRLSGSSSVQAQDFRVKNVLLSITGCVRES